MQWLIPVATAAWGIWRWSEERQLEHRRERERTAALYLTPFLSACDDLQSRIYGILVLKGPRFFKKHFPHYPEETLYLIVRFFGWLATVLRYGPYPHDSEMIQLAEKVRTAFGVSRYPVGPFSFCRPEQKALGKLVMEKFRGQYGFEFDTIPLYEFEKRLQSPPLSESEPIRQSLEALRNADDLESLQGRDRLAVAQNHLVDLLNYLEAKAGISFFIGERDKCPSPSISISAENRVSSLRVSDLREIARQLGIRGSSRLRKAELRTAIERVDPERLTIH